MYIYDLFISHASENKDIADKIVEKLEGLGYKCFIAPRDIRTGEEYAGEIVRGISNSAAVVLVFSKQSDQSGYVLREINSAVSRNKSIMPLRIEDFLPSEAMEFYLGPAHWLDAFPEIMNQHLEKIANMVETIKYKSGATSKVISVAGPQLVKISEIEQIGLSARQLVAKEIELDYMVISNGEYIINDSIEGTLDEWVTNINDEDDTSILLVQDDELIGYCDLYPVNDDDYRRILNSEVMIKDYMIELYSLGGEFNCYIGMLAINPIYEKQQYYLMIFKWIVVHLKEWSKEGIEINELALSVYSSMLEKFVKKFGFEFVGYNLAKGKIYKIAKESFMESFATLINK